MRIKRWAVGAEHFILSTDLGQTGNPSHPDGHAMLVAGLLRSPAGCSWVDGPTVRSR